MTIKGKNRYNTNSADNVSMGQMGFKVITAGDGVVTGDFVYLVPDNGIAATFVAESYEGDDLPSGSRFNGILGTFKNCNCTVGVVLAYYG